MLLEEILTNIASERETDGTKKLNQQISGRYSKRRVYNTETELLFNFFFSSFFLKQWLSRFTFSRTCTFPVNLSCGLMGLSKAHFAIILVRVNHITQKSVPAWRKKSCKPPYLQHPGTNTEVCVPQGMAPGMGSCYIFTQKSFFQNLN